MQIKNPEKPADLHRCCKGIGLPDPAVRAPVLRLCMEPGKGGIVDMIGLPGYHIECKHHERIRLYEWMKQAIRDSEQDGSIPVIVHKQNRKPVLVTLLLTDFPDMVNVKNSTQ